MTAVVASAAPPIQAPRATASQVRTGDLRSSQVVRVRHWDWAEVWVEAARK